MFHNCKLNTTSVQNIANTINNVSDLTNGSSNQADVYKTIDIKIANSSPNEDEISAFNLMVSKGWVVNVNGSSYVTSSVGQESTLEEDDAEIRTLIPYYAKPISATEEDGEFIDENGNFFNIVGAQFIYGDDISTYGMFMSLDDAAANMRLTKVERNQVQP